MIHRCVTVLRTLEDRIVLLNGVLHHSAFVERVRGALAVRDPADILVLVENDTTFSVAIFIVLDACQEARLVVIVIRVRIVVISLIAPRAHEHHRRNQHESLEEYQQKLAGKEPSSDAQQTTITRARRSTQALQTIFVVVS